MIILDVLDEITAALAGTGVSVPNAFGEIPVQPPVALLHLPPVVFDTGGRGFDRLPDVAIAVLIGDPTDPATYRTAATYADGVGPTSVKQAVQAYPYAACSTVRIVKADPVVATLQGVSLLGWMFHADVTGTRG
jgi:hypothetical protein